MDALDHRRIGSCATIARLYRWTGEERKSRGPLRVFRCGTSSSPHALAFRAEKAAGRLKPGPRRSVLESYCDGFVGDHSLIGEVFS